MGDEQTTINAEAPSTPDQSSEELVSTVDIPIAMNADTDPEGAKNTEAAKDVTPAEGKEAEGAVKPKEGEGTLETDDSTRYDKIPRFIELNTRVKTAESQTEHLLAQNKELMEMVKTKQVAPKEPTTPAELPYKDTSLMTSEQLLDWQSEDPKAYQDNLRKEMDYRITQGINSFKEEFTSQANEQTEEQKVVKTFDAYAEKNPDFNKMWDSGEIKTFMDANPGHNAISAHQTLTEEARTQASVDKAVDAALEKATTDLKAKRKSAVLGTGPTSVPATGVSDAELKEPGKYGGATSVLASRLAARRAG